MIKHVKMRTAQYALAAAFLLAAPAAYAQTIGHYQGSNNEGDEVDVYVDSDGAGGYIISSFDDGGTVYCGGISVGYGVGFGGFDTPIVGGTATFDYLSTNVYFNGTFDFIGAKKLKGKMRFGVPLFTSSTEPPKKAGACLTKPQTYTATYVGSDTAHVTSKGAVAWPLVTKK
jgi:hypothetical protein